MWIIFGLFLGIAFVGAGIYFDNDIRRKIDSYRTFIEFISFDLLKHYTLFRCRSFLSRLFNIGHLEFNGGVYELTFYAGVSRYKIRFPKKRGVRNITCILDEDENDITPEFFELLGPGNNFYNVKDVTPRFLGYSGVYIENRQGARVWFDADNVINL